MIYANFISISLRLLCRYSKCCKTDAAENIHVLFVYVHLNLQQCLHNANIYLQNFIKIINRCEGKYSDCAFILLICILIVFFVATKKRLTLALNSQLFLKWEKTSKWTGNNRSKILKEIINLNSFVNIFNLRCTILSFEFIVVRKCSFIVLHYFN